MGGLHTPGHPSLNTADDTQHHTSGHTCLALSFTPQVKPGFTPAPHCRHTYTSLPGQLHFNIQTAALHCPDSHTPLSGQLHFTVWTAAFHCLDSCTPESSQLHSTAQTATLHCPDGSPPLVPRYSWQKNNHKFHINNIAFVLHECFHKLQSFFKTSRNPQFT